MKKAEWERRIPLDLSGLQLLGAALTMQAERVKDDSARILEQAEVHDNENPYMYPGGVDFYRNKLKRDERAYVKLHMFSQALETPQSAFERAKKLRVMDFRFRWDHLKEHLILVGYITDKMPLFAASWDRSKPICEFLDTDAPSEALRQIFQAEYRRINGPDPDRVPYLRDREDFLFYLTVWQHCELESGRGHPAGRRWPDGLYNAASYAYSIRADARERGEKISNEEAIRRSLEKFDIICPDEFWEHPDKESAVVTAAGTKDDRLCGAIKAVRKKLAEFDKADR